MQTINLSGSWRYETDPMNTGISEKFYERKLKNENFILPGSACENAVGEKQEKFTELTEQTVRCLRQRYSYTGALWLQREFELPEGFENKNLTLFFERINMASDLWIDGIKIGRQIIELSTPHIYGVTGKLTPGIHTITIRLDNSDLINADGMSSGYSDDTQSIWIGIIGKIELRCEDIFRISNIQLFPSKNSVTAKLTACSDCASPHDKRSVIITLQATAPDGTELTKITYEKAIYTKKQIIHLDYPMGENIEYWDEFNPALYKMTATLTYNGVSLSSETEDICTAEHEASKITYGYDEKTVTFGMRTIAVKGREFILNGKAIALRGTLDCAIYPMTGYPPTDIETWLHTMRTIKEYGLNHIRFHAWCPPEAAFAAADMTGVYILAEMPFWLNTDVCALAAGDDPIHKYYYSQEMVNISQAFGNHPSFIMFSNGNELLGDFELLENMTTQIKALDNRRLYTLTSNFDRAVSPADDYFCAFQAADHRIRIQVFHDVISEHTRLSYDDAIDALEIPVVSFEVGQYCVYPNVDSVSEYTGNMLPVNFEIIGEKMKQHNIYHKLKDYIYASGKLAALLYKEDIEASLRTHKMGGFQLLGLADYTGQGTATIGLLDVFWNSKGLITPKEFREFCSPVVPLMKADRIFGNTENFTADFDLYNYGNKDIENIVYTFSLYDNDTLIYKTSTSDTSISFSLDFISKPSMLTAVLSVEEFTNRWNIFVYPAAEYDNKIPVINGYTDKLEEIIQNGGKAIVIADTKNLKNPIEGLFKPVFWSPAWFKSQRACGLICDNKHPIFREFPTDSFANFQWKHPIDNSVSTDISSLPEEFNLLIEPVPNFFDNTPRSPLFEAKIGNADILFCGFNFDIDKKAVCALKYSIMKYVNSDEFNPSQRLDENLFKQLFK